MRRIKQVINPVLPFCDLSTISQFEYVSDERSLHKCIGTNNQVEELESAGNLGFDSAILLQWLQLFRRSVIYRVIPGQNTGYSALAILAVMP